MFATTAHQNQTHASVGSRLGIRSASSMQPRACATGLSASETCGAIAKSEAGQPRRSFVAVLLRTLSALPV